MMWSRLFVLSLALAFVSCSDGSPPKRSSGNETGARVETGTHNAKTGSFFSDVAESRGLSAKHVNGFSDKKYMPETVGSGGALVDFNGDGRLDVYLVNQCSLADPTLNTGVTNRLYFQTEAGDFVDVTESSGAAADAGFGQGCAAADYDGDGDQDLYLSNLGRNRLLANDGKGRFEDVTDKAGVGHDAWGMSGIFFDFDRDGDLDLFSVNYVDFTVAKNVDCYSGGLLAYCSPHAYDPTPNTLYRNEGDGTFSDVSDSCGIGAHKGKGLGVAIGDYDADGWLDVYVANDGTANFLFRNLGNGKFEEVGVESGTAFNESGVAEAGMGTDFADLNGDGRLDILVTNLNNELNNLFMNTGDGIFEETARTSGLGAISNPYVGFGARAFDYDLDGDQDVYIANGHITDNITEIDPEAQYEQHDFLFLNDGQGKFREVLIESGDVPRRVGRGLATGDIDNDGDLDLLVTNNGQRPLLLRNDQKLGMAWVGFDLEGKALNRDAVGTVFEYPVGDRKVRYQHVPRGSFVSAHDRRVVLGLGSAADSIDLTLTWPDGTKQELNGLVPGRYYRLKQGEAPAPTRGQ